MFKETLKYVKDIVTAINIKTVEANKANVDLEPVTLTWKSKVHILFFIILCASSLPSLWSYYCRKN